MDFEAFAEKLLYRRAHDVAAQLALDCSQRSGRRESNLDPLDAERIRDAVTCRIAVGRGNARGAGLVSLAIDDVLNGRPPRA